MELEYSKSLAHHWRSGNVSRCHHLHLGAAWWWLPPAWLFPMEQWCPLVAEWGMISLPGATALPLPLPQLHSISHRFKVSFRLLNHSWQQLILTQHTPFTRAQALPWSAGDRFQCPPYRKASNSVGSESWVRRKTQPWVVWEQFFLLQLLRKKSGNTYFKVLGNTWFMGSSLY